MSRLLAAICVVVICAGPAHAQQLSWTDCLAEAQKNNPELIAAKEAIAQKEAARDVVKSEKYPQVSAGAGASVSKTEGERRSETYTADVSGSQLIFDAGKTDARVNAAVETRKAAEQGFRFTSAEVRFSLRAAFVELLAAQELVAVNEEIVKMRRESLELISLRYHSGLEHRGALLTAEANAAAAQFSLTQAARSIETAQHRLSAAMGRQRFSPVSVAGCFSVRESTAHKPDLDVLAQAHPSVLQSLASKNTASFNIKTAQADYYPALTGSAGAGLSGVRRAPDTASWDAGLSLTMPIFEGGLRVAQVAQAQAALRQAVQDSLSVNASVVMAMQEAWQDLQDAVDNVAVSKKALEAAQERVTIAEAQYATGFISFDSWIIIQDDLVSSKRSYLQAQASALLAEAAWIRAKGETIEYASQ